MEYDVFISYSRRDYVDEHKQVIPGNIVSKIKDLFTANGISYWFDEDGVFSGDAFGPVIARNIKAAKIFLFISSENSNVSEWTSNEIATAHSYKKKIIPFRYDDSVYNDSVIIYIARLDYIEYNSNPEKSLERLLYSVKTYLSEESERQERERQEEERRRYEEMSRQERAAKLQGLRERVEHLENRKFEIDKEILAQEKTLAELRNEKRIIESNISDLLDEEAAMSGKTRVKTETSEESNKTNANNKNKSQETAADEKSSQGLFARKIAELKSAMSLKHWSVNALQICILVILAFFMLIDPFCDETFAIVAIILGVLRVLNNGKSGIWMTGIASILLMLYYGLYYYGNELLVIQLILTGVFIVSLFIRKDGRSAWSVMQKPAQKLKKDILLGTYIVCMILMLLCMI